MNKTALLTGASGGIGFELAKIFALYGHDLVLVARRGHRLEECADYLQKSNQGIKVSIICADLSVPGQESEVYRRVKEEGRHIDILVNNAGTGTYGTFHEHDLSKAQGIINLNIGALTSLTRLFMQDMVNRGNGRILNVASLAAFQPVPFMAVYAASKAYVLSFSEAIASELKGTGVQVSVLCPGFTKSSLTEQLGRESGARVFRHNMMDAEYVALEGYKGLMKGKSIIIPGFSNKLLQLSGRLAPRKWITAFSKMLVERK
ncbi:hypothetical protein SD70_29135 [Gordoniibacillus kamchatkensis]|uniref:Short-chain dehydrogenase n=1 Tax=Gordoniibacillus kamchatkensis TaxID=1590651 RepID=A0ABR5AAN8_9BACL|nr:SDR family oxidoreductase [Paenibacillus sp. VKM B-2647]KIL38030.1 hypothetical protein SD70_29135 [Paenibacillus sp. VKM B-2647]